MTKREKIIELSRLDPPLSRAEIAKQAECSRPFVTQVLGAVRKYQKQIKQEPAVAN